jgi:hypothetical protein
MVAVAEVATPVTCSTVATLNRKVDSHGLWPTASHVATVKVRGMAIRPLTALWIDFLA